MHKLNLTNLTALLVELKKTIEDEFRATEDDNIPAMQVTVASNDVPTNDWGWQTGDNCYSGACYHYKHWAVIHLYNDSNCRELAREALADIREALSFNEDKELMGMRTMWHNSLR